MPLSPISQILSHAVKNKYAVGAFNANNMEIVQAIMNAAEEERAPVIIQASQGALKYAGIEFITAMVRAKAERTDIPVALHLDHGTSLVQVIKCLREGFTSVMYDGSSFPLEENIQQTREVVKIAHAAGISVEGELGRIGGTEDDITVGEKEAFFTDPSEAEEFVKRTSVDALAVAIGTAHGPYKGDPRLDFDRLYQIKEKVKTPLVLHGASGVPEESIERAITLGISKINIDTELRQAFSGKVKEQLKSNPEEYDPRKILGPAREATREVIQRKMKLFGCSGRI